LKQNIYIFQILFFFLIHNNLFTDAPGTPNITGVTSETILEEGQIKRLTCISMAGNPLADLKWFR
jgi:hypothetical protein